MQGRQTLPATEKEYVVLSSVTHAEDKGGYPQAGVYGEGDLKSLHFFEPAIPVSPIRRYVQPLISARTMR